MKVRNLYWGVFFILAAVIIVLNQMGLLIGVSTISLIITLLLIPVIITSIRHWSFGGILFPLAIIGILYAEPLGIQNLIPWPILGVALFLTIGLHFIFPHHRKYEQSYSHHHDDSEEWTEEKVDAGGDGEIDLITKFTGSVKYINSEKLRKVNIDCSFGGMKVYFDNSKLQTDEAIIDVNISFGGVELYLPKDWAIVDKVNCVLGGIEEKNRNQSNATKTIILKGKVSFSGITIIYV